MDNRSSSALQEVHALVERGLSEPLLPFVQVEQRSIAACCSCHLRFSEVQVRPKVEFGTGTDALE